MLSKWLSRFKQPFLNFCEVFHMLFVSFIFILIFMGICSCLIFLGDVNLLYLFENFSYNTQYYISKINFNTLSLFMDNMSAISGSKSDSNSYYSLHPMVSNLETDIEMGWLDDYRLFSKENLEISSSVLADAGSKNIDLHQNCKIMAKMARDNTYSKFKEMTCMSCCLICGMTTFSVTLTLALMKIFGS